jgi:hypothetical protein
MAAVVTDFLAEQATADADRNFVHLNLIPPVANGNC